MILSNVIHPRWWQALWCRLVGHKPIETDAEFSAHINPEGDGCVTVVVGDVAERQEVSRGWQAIRRSVRLKECARCHMLMGGLPELQIAFNGFTKAMIKGGTMKRLALLAVIWLGCGGSGGVYNEHYDRQCSVVFPTGGQCNTCGPTGTPIVTFACGSSCIPAESHCSVGPGCACNVFKVVQAP